MKIYSELRLREKIIFMMMVVSITTLAITNVLYVARMIPSLKQNTVAEYSNYATLIGNSVIGSLLFADTDTANEVLRPLANQKSIVSAVIFDSRGNYFAGYAQIEPVHPDVLTTSFKESEGLSVDYSFLQNNLEVNAPIAFDGTVIGYIQMQVDVANKNFEFYSQLIISILTFIVSILLAYILATRLQKVITGPVNKIVSLMQKVSQTNDFSTRASLSTNDELAKLGDGFNDMLSRLQSRDAELVEYREQLEEKVVQRTQQLNLAIKEANAATEAKSDFLAKMSHEIRTPLNAIIGFSNLTLRTHLQPEQRENLVKVLNSSETLLGLINDILDFSKIEAGKLTLESVDFDVDKVVQRALNVIGLRAHEKNIELISYIDPAVPNFVVGDPLRLQQIIINLCSNAVKFTESGSVTVMVKRKRAPITSGIKLIIEVADTGIGISKQQQSKLFQSFSQADNSVTRKYGGTGLGLIICKQLSELMGGGISVESEPGQGSTFIVTAVFGESKAPLVSAPQTFDALADMNLLVVDDNDLTRKVICDCLQQSARKIDTATDGLEALQQVKASIKQRQPYDLIIMDWKMPNMDGLEAAKIIKNELGLDSSEILMISAYDKEQVLEEANKIGVSHFLEKPFSARSLIDYLHQMLLGETSQEHTEEDNGVIPKYQGLRILLVEDNKLNQQVAKGFLAETLVELDIVENGQRAIEKLSQPNDYKLVLMDVQMPVMDGLTATQKIRNELKLDVPVIAMTAHAMDSDIIKAEKAGMNGYLSKPIDVEALYRILDKYLGGNNPEGMATSVVPQQMSYYQFTSSKLLQDIQHIRELDVDSALKLYYGQYQMFEDFVHEFITDQQLRDDLKTAIDDQNMDEINRTSHTLKSLLSYVGAVELRDMASAIEVSSGDPSNNQADILKEAARLSIRLENLTVQLKQAIAPRAPSSSSAESLNLDEIMARLGTLLASRDMEAEETAVKLANVLKGSRSGPLADEIADLSSQLKFEAALELLEKMRQAQRS